MSLVYKLNGSTLATSRVFYNYQGAEDWEMSQDATGPGGGQGTVTIQDPNGDLTVRTWMPFTAEESSSSQPRLVTSWITKVTERRGSYTVGVGREFACELADPNVLLGLRLISGRDGIRPTETDDARLAWLIASDYLDGIVFDTGFINGNGTTFDGVDYRGQHATDVLNDLARGRIYFAFWDPTANEVGLFFDLPDSTLWTSTISVSNVATDVNNSTVFALSDDATWERDGEGVYSTIRYVWLGPALTVHNATTASTFFPSPLLDRGETVETSAVGKAATAASQASILLAQASDEAKTLKGRIWLPAAQAGFFLAGQRASFRASHFTGLTTATYLHLNRVTYKPWADHPGYYEVSFEASNFGITGSGGGGSPGPGPHEPPGDAVHFFSGSYDYTSENYGSSDSGSVTPGSNTTFNQLGDVNKDFPAGDYTYDVTITPDPADAANTGQWGLMSDDGTATWLTPHLSSLTTTAGVSHTTGSFTVTLGYTAAMLTSNWAGTSHVPKTTHLTFVIDPVGWDPGTTDTGPLPLQWTTWTTVTMTGATGTTDFPYRTGSLEIKVDGVLISPASYAETDNETGDFTLDWSPDTDEVVTVRYQGI